MTRKRRGRGEGGIRYREDKNIWVGEVRTGTGQQRRTVYGKTKKKVQEKLRKLYNDVAAGICGDATLLTVGQWLTRWLEQVKPTVEPNTYNPYERHVRLHITPYLGAQRLTKLAKPHIRTWYADMANAGVSAALQRKVGTTLTIALNQAVNDDLLPGNPAMKVRKPKAKKPEMIPLDLDQVGSFLRAAKADRLSALYQTALDSGARPGELFALLWSDLDLQGRFITVTKSLEEINGALRVKPAKTAKSRRRIDLSLATVAALAEHRQVMLAEGHADGPVFCDTHGGYLRQSNLRRNSFMRLLERANQKAREEAEKISQETGKEVAPKLLPNIRLYDLRHTCATLLLLADVPAKVVSERLGHSSITLTLDTYSHVLPTMQRRAADLMGEILGRKPSEGSMAANGGTMAVQCYREQPPVIRKCKED
jgi:integrase